MDKEAQYATEVLAWYGFAFYLLQASVGPCSELGKCGWDGGKCMEKGTKLGCGALRLGTEAAAWHRLGLRIMLIRCSVHTLYIYETV